MPVHEVDQGCCDATKECGSDEGLAVLRETGMMVSETKAKEKEKEMEKRMDLDLVEEGRVAMGGEAFKMATEPGYTEGSVRSDAVVGSTVATYRDEWSTRIDSKDNRNTATSCVLNGAGLAEEGAANGKRDGTWVDRVTPGENGQLDVDCVGRDPSCCGDESCRVELGGASRHSSTTYTEGKEKAEVLDVLQGSEITAVGEDLGSGAGVVKVGVACRGVNLGVAGKKEAGFEGTRGSALLQSHLTKPGVSRSSGPSKGRLQKTELNGPSSIPSGKTGVPKLNKRYK